MGVGVRVDVGVGVGLGKGEVGGEVAEGFEEKEGKKGRGKEGVDKVGNMLKDGGWKGGG